MNNVIKKINKLVNKDNYIVLGVSSGPDSMCLLDILLKNNYKIIVAHVNYHKRKESIIEEDYLREYCTNKNIIFEKIEVKKYTKENFQKQARDIRYDFFKKLAYKYKTKYIMTAHNAEDLVETILMRINRGSNLKGYSGFEEMNTDEGYTFLKPLINISKKDILKYNETNNIKFFIDSSNNETNYTRNKYRKYILPVLENENPNYLNQFYEFSSELLEINSYIETISNKNKKHCYKDNVLNVNIFNNYEEVIKKRIISLILGELYEDDIIYITKKNLQDILKLTKSNNNIEITLPKKLIVRKSYDKLYFESEKTQILNYKYVLDKKVILPNQGIISTIESSNDISNYIIRLNTNEIKMPIIIRTRQQGDKIKVKNSGFQKINDIFINEKIDKRKRDIFPVVVDSNNVVIWLPRLKKSTFDTKNDYNIILEYIEEVKR